jgi:hypothetical protein
VTVIAPEAPRVLHPVSAAPAFQLMLYAEPVHTAYRYNRDTIDADAQAKVLAQLERSGGAPRRRKLTRSRSMSDQEQAREYAKVMGRTWNEVDPEPSAEQFSGPKFPDIPYDDPAWGDTYAAWRAEHDAWKATPEYDAYQAAMTYWVTRREQFDWTGRGKVKSLAELTELTIDGRPA